LLLYSPKSINATGFGGVTMCSKDDEIPNWSSDDTNIKAVRKIKSFNIIFKMLELQSSSCDKIV